MVVQRYLYVNIDPIVKQVATLRMMELRTRFPQQFATTACQGFSAIRFGEGLSDTRFGLFTDMVRLITWAQSISPLLGYVIENTPSQLD
jgi:hypothetical protein